jgi:hypothetical protein
MCTDLAEFSAVLYGTAGVVQHVTVPNTVGNCNTVVIIIVSYYNIIILSDHRLKCGPSLTETSLWGA